MLPMFSIDKIQRKLNSMNLAELRAISESLETIRIARPKPVEIQDQEEFDADIKWRSLIFIKNAKPGVLGHTGRREIIPNDFPKVKEIILNTSWQYRFSPRFEDKDKKLKYPKRGAAYPKYVPYDAAMDKSNWLFIDRMLLEYENIFQGKTGILPTMVGLNDMKIESRFSTYRDFAEVPFDQIIFADQKSGHGFPYAIRGINRENWNEVPEDWRITINRDLPVKQWKVDKNHLKDPKGGFLRMFEQNPVLFTYTRNGSPLNTHNFKVNDVSVEFY